MPDSKANAMSTTVEIALGYAPRVARGTNAEKPPRTNLGKFIQEVRHLHEVDKLGFARLIGCNQSYVGQIESGDKVPSAKYVEKIHHLAALKQMDTMRLVYAWLEANKLQFFVSDIKGSRGNK